MVRDDDARRPDHRQSGRAHREPGRLEDVDAINHPRADLADSPANPSTQQPPERCFPLVRAQKLGISDAVVHGYRLETHGTGHHRSGERTPSDLIDSDNGVGFSQKSPIPRTENNLAKHNSPPERSIRMEKRPRVRQRARSRSLIRAAFPRRLRM